MTDRHTDPTVKHDALLLFDAVDSNPNGDPDNAGKPRTDLDSGHGLASDASLKRKIRDSVLFQVEQELIPAERNGIFIRRGVSLNEQLEAASKEAGVPLAEEAKRSAEGIAKTAQYMLEHYFDVRMFGAVMSTGKASAGKVTGPVTVGIARTLDPVLPMDLAITRTASTKEEDRANASQMGNKSVIPYGLFASRIHYQPTKKNHVIEEDLRVLWTTIATMFEVTRSAARPDITVRGLHVFSHSSGLGNAQARSLFDRVTITKTCVRDVPTGFGDYDIVTPVESDLPDGVTHAALV